MTWGSVVFVVNLLSLNEGEILRREEGWICGLSMKLKNRSCIFGLMTDYLISGKMIFCSLISAYVNGTVTKSIAWFRWMKIDFKVISVWFLSYLPSLPVSVSLTYSLFSTFFLVLPVQSMRVFQKLVLFCVFFPSGMVITTKNASETYI